MLGNKAISEAMSDGRIVITPFHKDQLGPNSYDLRIGEWIVRQKKFSFEWARDTYKAQTSPDYKHVRLTDPVDPTMLWDSPVQAVDGTIALLPGELILAHTDEHVGCYENVCGEMASRSTLMRMGIAVCVDAGLGDVGFSSRWTMEVINYSQSVIVIPVGARVAQMKFHEVVGNDIDYSQKGGTYGIGEWSPDDMLPRSGMS